MRSRFSSTVRRPIPFTSASCSGLRNAPLALRWATIASALAGPMFFSTRSSVAASAVLMFTFSLANALPSRASDSSSEANRVLKVFMWILRGV